MRVLALEFQLDSAVRVLSPRSLAWSSGP